MSFTKRGSVQRPILVANAVAFRGMTTPGQLFFESRFLPSNEPVAVSTDDHAWTTAERMLSDEGHGRYIVDVGVEHAGMHKWVRALAELQDWSRRKRWTMDVDWQAAWAALEAATEEGEQLRDAFSLVCETVHAGREDEVGVAEWVAQTDNERMPQVYAWLRDHFSKPKRSRAKAARRAQDSGDD